MENYILPENATLENFAAIETDMASNFVSEALAISDGPIVVFQRNGTPGEIVEVSGESFDSLCCTVRFDDCLKKYQLKAVLGSNFITFENIAIKALYDSYSEASKQLYIKRADFLVQSKHAEKEAVRKQAKEKAREAKEKDREAKYQAGVDRAKKAFNDLAKSEKRHPGDAAEFFHFLGWLTEHTGAFSAIIPDFLASAFESWFSGVPKTVVNTKVLTPGGHIKHWGCEIKCGLKGLKKLNPPPYINLITSDWTQGIHNTPFLWHIIENYGFQIGKHQDIDRILNCIPARYLDDFNAGRVA